MKQVILLGDSIRLGYQNTVKTELTTLATVWSPDDNCMHSINHLINLGWYLDRPADVIHFNFGLWDCRRLCKEHSENLVPVELFARNLDFLLGTLRDNTKAVLIWATLTPILQERYNARFTRLTDPSRQASDINRYNSAAAPILAKHGVHVNDLHAYVTSHSPEQLICEDGVHYTDEGSRQLGLRVASHIKNAL